MKKVLVFQETLATDGINASRMISAGSIADVEDGRAAYLVGMDDAVYMNPPANTTPPVLDKTTVAVGGVISCTTGVWTGNAPITYARQWLRDGANIAGATGASYTAVAGDSTHSITCRVTATNSIGNASAVSSNACAVT